MVNNCSCIAGVAVAVKANSGTSEKYEAIFIK